jgi:outer membrane protein assembly factor BamB
MVFSSGKHGWVVAANSETGAELWRTAVGEHNDAEFATGDQIPAPGATPLAVLPGALGGVETPIAYADGQVFAPAVNLAFAFTGSTYEIVGGNLFDGTGTLVALDAATGAINWSVDLPTLILGGATVANDIVFTAGLDGLLRGFNVADGTQVYTFQASAGVNASPAISGDYLFLPAGGFLSPSADTVSPAPELKTELIALKLGAGSATPVAS